MQVGNVYRLNHKTFLANKNGNPVYFDKNTKMTLVDMKKYALTTLYVFLINNQLYRRSLLTDETKTKFCTKFIGK